MKRLLITVLLVLTSYASAEEPKKISVTLTNNKTVSCEFDNLSKHYLCPNDKNPILVRPSPYGYLALDRDKFDTPRLSVVLNVISEGKVLYETPPAYGGMSVPDQNLGDLNNDTSDRISNIVGFFTGNYEKGTFEERKIGSLEYEKIATAFLADKDQMSKQLIDANNEKEFEVELANGQKINCQRDITLPLPEDLKKIGIENKYNFQCGNFTCDPLVIDGVKYEATMLYETAPSVLTKGTLHLIGSDGIGPQVAINKISSPKFNVPLADNTILHATQDEEGKESKKNIEKMLPASLKQNKESIAAYKDPNFRMYLKHYQKICKDEKGTLKTLVDARKKLMQKLADTELAEFIQVLDGLLIGSFIDPLIAPQLGCMYEGVYLNQEAAKNLDLLKKNIHPDKFVEQTISLDRATELFNKAAAMDDIAWKYKEDGCYARAHLMARRFEEEGVRVDKVWIKGDLYVPGTTIRWNFHVAPIVYVEDEKGKIQKMVIDPSLFNKPVTVEEWDNRMSKTTAKGSVITAFPYPENAAFMERSSLSFSSSDPYLPTESIYTSEDIKMMLAKETMKTYKPLETK